jgi:hypothetical protein
VNGVRMALARRHAHLRPVITLDRRAIGHPERPDFDD